MTLFLTVIVIVLVLILVLSQICNYSTMHPNAVSASLQILDILHM